jgi:hypothetical protein
MYKNSVRNQHIDFRAKRVFIPASSYIQANSAGTTLDSFFGTGTSSYVEMGGSGNGAIRFAATGNDANYLWVPTDFDNRHPLYIRYMWTSEYAVANGTATFTTLYTAIRAGASVVIGATALTKTHTASTKVSSARALYWTPYGAVTPLSTGANAGHTFDPEAIVIALNTTVSAVTGITIATDFVYLVGTELTYTPLLSFGSNDRPARMLKDGLHSNLELDVANDI